MRFILALVRLRRLLFFLKKAEYSGKQEIALIIILYINGGMVFLCLIYSGTKSNP
jgi:hypothetical protein